MEAQVWALSRWPLHSRSALRTLGMLGAITPISRETDTKPDSQSTRGSGL